MEQKEIGNNLLQVVSENNTTTGWLYPNGYSHSLRLETVAGCLTLSEYIDNPFVAESLIEELERLRNDAAKITILASSYALAFHVMTHGVDGYAEDLDLRLNILREGIETNDINVIVDSGNKMRYYDENS